MLVVGDDLDGDEPVLLRVHSECLTGDAFSQPPLRLRRPAGARAWRCWPRPGAG